MTEPSTNKFWHPLPFWRVILIALGVQVLTVIGFVIVRVVTGLDIPYWVAGGVGGAAMVFAIRGAAVRALAAQSAK